MRILCLHGVGTSASVFERQLATFLRAADPSYEFVFVDGPAPWVRGPGMDSSVPGPFYSHMAGYSPPDIQEAHAHVATTIDELGPFDGVMGFSQGGSLALSYLYTQQQLGQAPDFGFAILFSSVVAFSPDPTYCLSTVKELCDSPRLSRETTPGDSDSDSEEANPLRLFHETLARTFQSAKTIGAVSTGFDQDLLRQGECAKVPRIMHPAFLLERLHVPTVHIVGKKDESFPPGMRTVTRDLCDPQLRRELEHSGGHHPPRTGSEVKKALIAMDWAIGMAQRRAGALL